MPVNKYKKETLASFFLYLFHMDLQIRPFVFYFQEQDGERTNKHDGTRNHEDMAVSADLRF